MDLRARPAAAEDLPALVALQQRFDSRWFGTPEHDEAEVRASFDRVDPLAKHSLLLHDGDRLLAAAWWWKDESTLLLEPELDDEVVAGEAAERLARWLTGSGTHHAEVLAGDRLVRAALEGQGWVHWLSQFELIRDALDPAPPPEPRWPEGVTVTSLTGDVAAVHRLIYVEARWADVPGHGDRDLAEWTGLFLAGEDPAQQVLAWDGDRLVGAALGKTFSDGTGWVSQVAVPADQQGSGLGTALLAEAFGRRVAAGATRIGLGVSAANADALRLYRRLGLEIDREWMLYRPGTDATSSQEAS